jgi:hypothetical protein
MVFSYASAIICSVHPRSKKHKGYTGECFVKIGAVIVILVIGTTVCFFSANRDLYETLEGRCFNHGNYLYQT